jgi:putative oxidoreductase
MSGYGRIGIKSPLTTSGVAYPPRAATDSPKQHLQFMRRLVWVGRSRMSWVRIFLSELHGWQWVGILVARIAVGLLFFLSGRGKLFVADRREQMRQTLIEAHVPFPEFNAVFVSIVEFVCGLLLVLGALTPLACAMLGCVMMIAIATTAIPNIKATSPLGWLSEFFYLPEVLCLVILVWLFFSGPGWVSVDRLTLSHGF